MKAFAHILIILGVLMPIDPAMAGKLRKIEIGKTNNLYLDVRFPGHQSLDHSGSEDLIQLAAYVKSKSRKIEINTKKDPEIIFTTLDWVSTQWQHDGMNQPPKETSALTILKNVHEKGLRYRCVEYGKVHSEILKSIGYQSRTVALRSVDAAYGGFGMGHVASEVWSNTLGKWIFVDPQFSIYPTYNGTFLSFYEMYELKKKGQFDLIEFNVSPDFLQKSNQTKEALVAKYRSFIEMYFGYMGINLYKEGTKYHLILNLEGKTQYLTFQGLGVDHNVFTDLPGDLYFQLNRTLMTFSFKKGNRENFMDLMSELQIETTDDYVAKMASFAARPHFDVKLSHNMRDFAYYEIKDDKAEDWRRINGDVFDLSLPLGDTQISARTVNKHGIPGPVTFINFTYR
jgi:hypothetical protein